MKKNSFICLFLIFVMLFTMCFGNISAFASDNNSKGTVIDFSLKDIISKAGLTRDTSVKYGSETQSAKMQTYLWGSEVSSDPVSFSEFSIEQNWQDVNTVCIRMYNKSVSNNVLNVIFNKSATDDLSKGYYLNKVTLDWTGWKTIKLPISSFTSINGATSWKNIQSFILNFGGWGGSSSNGTQVNFSSVYGLKNDVSNPEKLIDFDEMAIINASNMQSSTDVITGIKNRSALLKDTGSSVTTTAIPFSDYVIAENWTDATHINIDIYNKTANNETVNLIFNSMSDNSVNSGYYIGKIKLDWTGWKTVQIEKSAFTAVNGISSWSNIKSFFINIGDFGASEIKNDTEIYLSQVYGVTKANDIENTFTDAVAVYCGVSNVLKGNQLVETDLTPEYKDEKIYIPANMLSNIDSEITVETTSSTTNINKAGNIYTFYSDNKNYKKNGEFYISADDIFRTLNMPYYINGRLVVVGNSSTISNIKSKTKHNLNTYCEDIIKVLCNDGEKSLTVEDCEVILEKWAAMLVGTENKTSNYFVNQEINKRNSYATDILGKIVKNDGNALFNDISLTSTDEMTRMFKRVYNLALAYATPECTLYQDENLKTEIIYCLDWLYENAYGRNELNGDGWNSVDSYNWWDWEVGVPSYLIPILILVSDELTTEQITNYAYLFDEIVNDVSDSGANFADTIKYMIGSAALKGDVNKVTYFRNKLNALYENLDDSRWTESQLYGDRKEYTRVKGSGFHSDGSYVFHTLHPHNGGYGASQYVNMAEFIYMFDGTNGEFSAYQIGNMYDWFVNSFDSLMYNNSIMRYTLGRTENPSQIFCTHLAAAVKCIDKFNEYERAYIEEKIRNFAVNGKDALYESVDINDMATLKTILSEDAQTDANSSLSKVFYNMDKVSHRRSDWAIGLSLSSSRIFNYESINNANKKGWYLSDGRTELYLKDEGNTSASTYWQYIDPYRLPGTTVDTKERKAVSIVQGNEYLSSKDFVGGVTLDGKYSVAAMDLESYHNDSDFGLDGGSYGGKAPAHNSDLTAKKSYFMFDNAVYCLGTAINETTGADAEVLTIVDNRISENNQKDSASGLYVANDDIYLGTEKTSVSADEIDYSTAKTLNINNKIGYYFPQYDASLKGSLKVLRTSAEKKSYVQLYFNHGTNPQNSAYAYALLPNMTAEQTKAYSENPGVEILANNESVQCVKNSELGITAIVFWEAGTFEGITVTAPMMVMIQDTGLQYKIAVSDPTQKLKNEQVILDKTFDNSYCDDGLNVSIDALNTTIDVDFSNIDGRSLSAEFTNSPSDNFTFNDADLSKKYLNSNGESALSKMTLNTDTDYTYGNAMYSALVDLSNGNKWGTEKASISKLGMTTDWSGYDILRIRYYSTIPDAYYSVFLTNGSDSNRYRFTVKADKVGWQIAEIDLNRMLKTGLPSFSNIQTIQIRTDNNSDSTGGTSSQVGSGATEGLKFYFDSFWLEKYENEEYISFTDDKVFDDANWYKDDGSNSKGKLAVTTSTYFAGSGKAGKIELTNQKWGTNHADLAKLGMTTDWSKYDTLKIRYKSKIQDAFYTIFFYCTDSYGKGGQYKVKVTARNADWNIIEIPLNSLKEKNSPSLDSIKYMQIRTDDNNDSGEQVGSGQVSGLTFYFDKIWLEANDFETELAAPVSSIENGSENVPVNLNGNNEIVYTFEEELKNADYSSAVSVMEVVDSVETVTSKPYSVIAEGNNLIIRFNESLIGTCEYKVLVNCDYIYSKSGAKLKDDISTNFTTENLPIEEPDASLKTYFTFNDANLAANYVNDNDESALSKMTLNTDTDYTYGNAMYSALVDLSNGNKWGTEKASISKLGMTTDWSGNNILRIRYYSTVADAYYSVFLTNGSDSNRYRFTVKADKVGWQIAEIDLNRMLKTGSPSFSNIQTIQIRTDNNSDNTGGTSSQVGSGATEGLKFYFDSFWLEKYENEEYISFTDDKVFDDANWYKDDGSNSIGKLAVTTSTYFAGSGKAGKIELTNQKWGTNYADLAKLGMTTDWTDYDTLKIRYKSKIQDAFYTIFFYCTDSYAGGGQYKVKVTARNADWNIIEIPLNSLKEKNSPSLDSIKYMQIRTDNNNDSGEQVGSGQVSGLTFYFDKIWLEKSDDIQPHDFKYAYANEEVVIKGIDALSEEDQINLVIPEEIDGYAVTKIDKNAFANNSNIYKVTLPETLKKIDNEAFSGCVNLSEVVWNEGLEDIGSLSFYSTKIKEFIAPKTLKTIGPNAFRTCNYLTRIILSSGITRINDYAFYRCLNIDGIYFPAEIPQSAYGSHLVGGFDTFVPVHAWGYETSYIKTLSETALDSEEGCSGNKLYDFEEVVDGVITFNDSFNFESGDALTGSLNDITNFDGTIGYKTSLYNVSKDAKEVSVICAVYDDFGRLAGMNFVNKTVPAERFVDINIADTAVKVSTVAKDYMVKGMIFSPDMSAYKKAVDLTISED